MWMNIYLHLEGRLLRKVMQGIWPQECISVAREKFVSFLLLLHLLQLEMKNMERGNEEGVQEEK